MTQPFVSSWHDPSDMKRSETNKTPNNEYAKDEMITDGGLQGPTLTLAPMGMVAPWRWCLHGDAKNGRSLGE